MNHSSPYLTRRHRTLEDIRKKIEAIRGSTRMRRIGAFLKDPEKIKDMKGRLDEVLKLFMVRAV